MSLSEQQREFDTYRKFVAERLSKSRKGLGLTNREIIEAIGVMKVDVGTAALDERTK